MKKILAITLFIVLFLVSLLIISPYFLRIGRVRDAVVSRLATDTRSVIKIRRLGWAWFPRPCIKASGVRIQSRSIDVEVPEAVAFFDLMGLFARRVDIGSITLRHPVVHYHGMDRKSGAGGVSGLSFPPLEFNIVNGELLVDVPGDLRRRLHEQDLKFRKINMVLRVSASGLDVSGDCLPPYVGALNIKGTYAFSDRSYQANISLRDIRIQDIFNEFLRNSRVRALGAGTSLHVNLSGKGGAFRAALKGDLPCVKVMPDDRDVFMSCGHADLDIERNSSRFAVRIQKLKLSNPGLVLSGEFSRTIKDKTRPARWHVDLSAVDVDLESVRRKLLLIWPENHVVRKVCSIVLGGKARHASFFLDGPASDFRHIHTMLIKASIENGRVHVPKADLMVDQVDGDVEISNGILHCSGLSGRMGGSSILSGRLDLGLHGHNPPFSMDLDLDADLSQLPGVLKKLVKSHGFQSELALFSDVEGRARGRLRMGDKLHHIKTVVDVQSARVKARYRRFPWKINIEKASLHVEPHAVSWKQVMASAGPHRIYSMDGRIDWSAKPVLSLSHLKANISSGPLYRYLSGYSSLKKVLSKIVTWTRGRLAISRGSMSGRLDRPVSWIYSMDVAPESLFFQSPLIFGPLHVSKGIVHISQDRVDMDGLMVMSEGNELKIGARLHHTRWHHWKGSLELDGEVGMEAAAWIRAKGWVPDRYLPGMPADLIGFRLGLRKSGVTVRGGIYPVAVESEGTGAIIDLTHDADGLHIHSLTITSPMDKGTLALDIGRGDRLDVRWKGRVTGATLDSLMEHNHILHGSISGDFSFSFDPARPGDFRAVGEIQARKFHWPWGPWYRPVDFEDVSISGSGNACRVRRFVVSLGPEKEKLSLSGIVSGVGDPSVIKVDLDSTSREISFRNLMAFVRTGQVKAASGGHGPEGAAKAGKKGCARFLGTVRFDFRTFHYRDEHARGGKPFIYTWSEVNGLVNFDPHTGGSIDVSHGDICGLQTTGKWRIGSGDSDGSGIFTVTTPFDRVEHFEDIMPCLGLDEDLIHGPFYLDLELKGRPGSWKDGFFRLRASNGKIWRFTMLAKIFSVINVLDLVSGGLPDLFSTGYAYSEMELSGRIKDNRLKMEKGVIRGEGINLFGSGSLDLSSYDVDATVLVAPLKTVDAVLGKIPLVGRIIGGKNMTLFTIPVGVKGPISDPRVIVLQPGKVGGAIFKWVTDTLKLPFEWLKGDE